ncbi:glycoside hydrolase family 17 protein [Xylariaceae sp. FL1272]|nr:glycoside hydrolase family 17 protein [Xylariaceae sp. FL1272]
MQSSSVAFVLEVSSDHLNPTYLSLPSWLSLCREFYTCDNVQQSDRFQHCDTCATVRSRKQQPSTPLASRRPLSPVTPYLFTAVPRRRHPHRLRGKNKLSSPCNKFVFGPSATMRLAVISFTLLSLLQLSLGQPQHRHGLRHRAHRAFPKRDKITVSNAAYTTRTELPEVVVYVDQYGKPIRTETETIVYIPSSTPHSASSSTAQPPAVSTLPSSAPAVAQPAPIPSSSAPSVATDSAPASNPKPQPSPVATELSTSSASVPATSSTSYPVSSEGNLHGVTYSPYKGNGNCKTADEVDKDFSLFAKDYGVIRLYGVDCNQVANVYQAAKKYGNKLMLGIFDITAVDSAVASMAAGVDHDWSIVDAVSVGNELVNNGAATPGQSVAALTEARSALRSSGYQGPVVIVDTFVAVLAHPELCDESDYCAVNVHPFFDPNTGAPQAGSFVGNTVKSISGKLADPGKRIVVTETGWPWQGKANGNAVPGLDLQASAITSIKSVFSSNAADVFLFTAFNDLWKKAEPGTFMAEQFWGMGGVYSPCDE